MTSEQWDSIQHFSRDELKCKCGCDTEQMDFSFMKLLDRIRKEMNIPLPISSGYRCPRYNNIVSQTGVDGPHTTGKAADVVVFGWRAHEFSKLAFLYGVTGFGWSQKGAHGKRYVHIDTLTEHAFRPTIWTY